MTEQAAIDWTPVLLLIGLAFAPGLFWILFFCKKYLDPEPLLHIIRNCFFAGIAAGIPAGIVELLLGGSALVRLVIVPSVVEECLKCAACALVAYRGIDFKEPVDGVVYAVSVAMGFASLENALWLYDAYCYDRGVFPVVTLLRAFFTVPAHALYGAMWGYGLGQAKFSDRKTARLLVVKGLARGIAMHAVFDLVVFFL